MAEHDIPSIPILAPAAAASFEAKLFAGNERKEWKAMVLAGRSVAQAAMRDYAETGAPDEALRLLVLAGKGNNAGDALIAARALLERRPRASCDVVFAFGPRSLKAPAARAWRELSESGRARVRSVGAGGLAAAYDLCLDGIFGFQYRPPLPAEARAVIMASAQARIRLRAAVDLPTGWSEAGAFKADFTYATGTVKEPIVGCPSAGRPRFLDLGFYPEEGDGGPNRGERVVLPSVLCPVAGLRRADADKRSQGRLVILGGSEGLPGAVLMTALAALKSGVGLLTVFVPESLAAAYAARAPEAMWAGLPVTAGGGLDPRGLPKVVAALAKADALAMGPGLGKDPKAREFARQVARISRVPMVIDAEALQPQIVRAGRAPRILTPHAGEFERIAGGATQRSLCSTLKACIVLKGPVTRISDGGAVYHSFFGGPVLARGGSGDILAGLAGGLLAQSPGEPLAAACRAAVWHAMAADHLARSQGQAAVRTLQLLDFLSAALRESHQGD